MSAIERLELHSTDGVVLEAELARPPGAPVIGIVLCHPHPQYGGTMRSIVIGALFDALPTMGALTLRFNFRGVEHSTGTYDNGVGEQEDARAAVTKLASELPAGVPLVLAGWSFGADMALSVRDDAVRAWVAIAPPLKLVADLAAVGSDPRPKLLALAENDEVCPASEASAVASGWSHVQIEVVPGASHFFIGRTDRLTEVVTRYVAELAHA